MCKHVLDWILNLLEQQSNHDFTCLIYHLQKLPSNSLVCFFLWILIYWNNICWVYVHYCNHITLDKTNSLFFLMASMGTYWFLFNYLCYRINWNFYVFSYEGDFFRTGNPWNKQQVLFVSFPPLFFPVGKGRKTWLPLPFPGYFSDTDSIHIFRNINYHNKPPWFYGLPLVCFVLCFKLPPPPQLWTSNIFKKRNLGYSEIVNKMALAQREVLR